MTVPEYLQQLDLALSAVGHSFVNNEHKNGKGVFLSPDKMRECWKAIGHMRSHWKGCTTQYGGAVENEADNCLHLTSAAARSLKALQQFLEENPEYVQAYNRTIEHDQNQ